MQVSAVVDEQALQAAPPAPHADAVGVTHWLFWQHPDGQLAALHWQAPPTHAWPWSQAGPAPQVQAPAVQRSVATRWQEVHTWPFAPQAESEAVMQAPAKQQPEQVVESQPVQLPATHSAPTGQT